MAAEKIFLPMPILTPRLEIRPPKISDSSAINEAVEESLDELKEFMPWAQKLPTLKETKQIVAEMEKSFFEREDIVLSIFDRKSGKLLGGTGLHRFNWKIPKFEIGYWCRSSESGKGIITESTTALLHYAFSHLKANRVEIHCDQKNLGSEKIMKKVGLELEGLLKNDDLSADGLSLRNTLIYAAINLDNTPQIDVSW